MGMEGFNAGPEQNPNEVRMQQLQQELEKYQKGAEYFRDQGDEESAKWNEEKAKETEQEIEDQKAIDRGDIFLPGEE
ncbi:MAG: hypothetical protein Q8O98_02225 [bacterium]|nr:hypothetical protein [bacterium]